MTNDKENTPGNDDEHWVLTLYKRYVQLYGEPPDRDPRTLTTDQKEPSPTHATSP